MDLLGMEELQMKSFPEYDFFEVSGMNRRYI